MKTLFIISSCLLFLLATSLSLKAQISQVQLGVNGLTCSQCTRSVEMRIRKLSFVKDVKMNLEHTEGRVVFKDNEKVNIDKIAQAVIDAGFSVRYLNADFSFNNAAVSSNYCFAYNNDNYQFVNTSSTTLNGPVAITFIGRNFLEKKEFKKWQPYMKGSCSATGKTYYVTLQKT